MRHTALNPSSAGPVNMRDTTLNPSSAGPVNMRDTTLNPSSAGPVNMRDTALSPSSAGPVNMRDTALNPSSAGPVNMRDTNSAITEPADVKAPNSAGPSLNRRCADCKNETYFPFKFLCWSFCEMFEFCWEDVILMVEKSWEISRHFRCYLMALGDDVWLHGIWSTLAQLMAWCRHSPRQAPSHYLNQCWLIVHVTLCHSAKDTYMKSSRHQSLKCVEKLMV